MLVGDVYARNDGIWFSVSAKLGFASAFIRSSPITFTGVGELNADFPRCEPVTMISSDLAAAAPACRKGAGRHTRGRNRKRDHRRTATKNRNMLAHFSPPNARP
ncbi:MAG: hypothetical protein WDN76_00790 [Alphaproteobacteria bacterium]